MPAGRPSSFTSEISAEICRLLEEGDTIRDICSRDGFPSWGTVRTWLRTNDEFRTAYALSREVSAEALEQDILDVSKGATDKDTAAVARVRIEAMKWVASKRAPRVYGDKLDLNHGGHVSLTTTLDALAERVFGGK